MQPSIRIFLAALILVLSFLVCVPGAYWYWHYTTFGRGSSQSMTGFIEGLLYFFSLPFSFMVTLTAAVLAKLAEGNERYVHVFSAVLSSFPWLGAVWLLATGP